jgi:hypothetical protein
MKCAIFFATVMGIVPFWAAKPIALSLMIDNLRLQARNYRLKRSFPSPRKKRRRKTDEKKTLPQNGRGNFFMAQPDRSPATGETRDVESGGWEYTAAKRFMPHDNNRLISRWFPSPPVDFRCFPSGAPLTSVPAAGASRRREK